MVFGFNGTHNDFYVLYFFMATSMCGTAYLSHCGFDKYVIPEISYKATEKEIAKKKNVEIKQAFVKKRDR